jgi:hypothetical protein
VREPRDLSVWLESGNRGVCNVSMLTSGKSVHEMNGMGMHNLVPLYPEKKRVLSQGETPTKLWRGHVWSEMP